LSKENLQPLGLEIRAAHPPMMGMPRQIEVVGNGVDRLVIVQTSIGCRTLCFGNDQLAIFTVGSSGERSSEPRVFDATGSAPRAVGLPDGRWIVIGEEILELAHDATLLRRSSNPLMAGAVYDMEPTPLGWRAVVGEPMRLVDVIGADTVVSVVGLRDLSEPHLGAGNVLVFLVPVGPLVPARGAWSGVLSARPGDLQMSVREISSGPRALRFELTVRNAGPTIVTGAYVAGFTYDGLDVTLPGRRDLPDLPPGGEIKFIALASQTENLTTRLFVLSDDIIDMSPSDNVVMIQGSAGSPVRRRGVTP
jgi:hypothetical protein